MNRRGVFFDLAYLNVVCKSFVGGNDQAFRFFELKPSPLFTKVSP